MARQVLGGPADTGRSNYQIALTVCARCGSGEQQGAGEPVAVGAEVIERARRDGQHVGYIDAPAVNENAGAASAMADDDTHTDGRLDADVGAEPHASDGAARRHAPRRSMPHPHPLAPDKPSRPPCRALLRRDKERCQVPGCKNATFLDLHHIDPRSEGGRNESENLITLCTVHHRAAHRGELLIGGRAPNPQFRHADGSEYGQPARPRAIEAQAKVFSALCHLGFRQGEVRRVMAELREESELREASAEQLLREALGRMGPRSVRSNQARWIITGKAFEPGSPAERPLDFL